MWYKLKTHKFRLKLNKVGKTTRPSRYDLNQIPYDYTVEVRNRFNGLDLIDREPDELWIEVRDIVEETEIKTIPMEKKCKKAKWLSEKALQITVKRREVKSRRERLYTWTSPDGQHQNQIDHIFYSQRWRSSIQTAKTRRGADCGSDHEVLTTKFSLKLK